ncbi:Kazal-type serine protease inhibitor domain [Phytophthora infestans]|uniref:Kazal-type serine protease inhibitor domain n=1 Tax=Phytophthora infestans TaxID=4787 RepID=A0A833SNS3_PHYIN|nr:Kazal-type serine protease inhibitor domain [Phytophthora infestans]
MNYVFYISEVSPLAQDLKFPRQSLKFEVMKFAIVAIFASILIVGISAKGFACAAVPYIICDGGNNPTVCASNGVTYWNRCDFYKANCDNKGLKVLHED